MIIEDSAYRVIKEDIDYFKATFKLKGVLSNTCFLVTGATGLIGSNLVKYLIALDCNIKIIALVRDRDKALSLLGENENLIITQADLCKYDYNELGSIDYIVHCAAPTASRYFVDYPVETISSIIYPTQKILEYAVNNPIKGCVFLSSLEIYGQILQEKSIPEEVNGDLDILSVRSSYPMAKRLAENLCYAYTREYHVPVKIARLTQTTGPGISKEDNRVFAQFVRNTINKEPITLFTSGAAARPYLYISDAIEALLYILIKGEAGNAYNVANEDTYISARDLASKVQLVLGMKENVHIKIDNTKGYPTTTYLNLDTSKLMALGWIPKYDLVDIIERLGRYLKKE